MGILGRWNGLSELEKESQPTMFWEIVSGSFWLECSG